MYRKADLVVEHLRRGLSGGLTSLFISIGVILETQKIAITYTRYMNNGLPEVGIYDVEGFMDVVAELTEVEKVRLNEFIFQFCEYCHGK